MLISKFKTSDISEKVRELEEKCSCIFPEQYRHFLEKYNGGYTPETSFKSKERSDLYGFYGVADAELNFASFEIEEWLPKKVIPIARDSFGNYIVIGINDERYGKIFFSDHELNWKLTNIAPDFKTFIKICKSKKIDTTELMTIEEREAMLIANGHAENITDSLKRAWQEEIDEYKNINQERVILN